MATIAEQYYQNLTDLIQQIQVTDRAGQMQSFYVGIEAAARLVTSRAAEGRKLLFIGNGASAAISSHMAADYSKNGQMRALAFNDAPLLTAVSNDLGFQHVFENPLNNFAETGDLLFAISSSGRSENVLRGVQAARTKGCLVLTLSGFGADNPLRMLGDLNFYVPAQRYGPVEVLHHSICHSILDVIITLRTPGAVICDS
jgi:D-sedoheptulose 7-phosphate isomerase